MKQNGGWMAFVLQFAACVFAGTECGALGIKDSQGNRIIFNTPSLTGDDGVKAPPSGKTLRDVSAAALNPQGGAIPDFPLVYSVEPKPEGVFLENDTLVITSAVKKSATLTVKAASAKNPSFYAVMKLDIIKDDALADVPPNPLEKPGYVLYHSSEFDKELDPRYWSGYYLRSWWGNRVAKSYYRIEDGVLRLTAPRNIGAEHPSESLRISGVMTFEKQYLHRFGTITEGRDIPVFDGLATKYGYFEMRLKLPNTRDGSHFAWWMVGAQEDQHPSVSLASDPEGTLFPGDGKGWGVETYYWTNRGAEYDIIEQPSDPIKAGEAAYRSWLPVIHKNGTRDYPGRWYAGLDAPEETRVSFTKLGIDPYNEFHIFGFEWDEEGTKFYLDNALVYSSDCTASYPMLTILSLYAGNREQNPGAFGWDRGIYPKETLIDYFRIYKKDEPPRPNAVVISRSPYYFERPASGTNTAQMKAETVDQFDQPIALKPGQTLRWRFSEDIGGSEARYAELTGVTVNPETGLVTVDASAPLNQDIFLTAFAEGPGIPENRKVRETRHIKLSQEPSEPRLVAFNRTLRRIKAGSSEDVSAELYDQYMRKIDGQIAYRLVTDIAAEEEAFIKGVSVDSTGVLTVSGDVPAGTFIIVNADSGFKRILEGQRLSRIEDAVMQNLILEVY
jgi:hypothetical protein